MGMPNFGIMNLSVPDKAALYRAYMPFLKHGGLFIPTNATYKLGQELFLLLQLPDDKEKLPVAGKVVWVTYKGAQNNRVEGIGIQFNDDNVRTKIEAQLAGRLDAADATYTF